MAPAGSSAPSSAASRVCVQRGSQSRIAARVIRAWPVSARCSERVAIARYGVRRWRPRRVRVGPDRGPVQDVQLPVQLPVAIGGGLERGQELGPDARLLSPPKAGVHALPGAIVRGQVAPRGAGA